MTAAASAATPGRAPPAPDDRPTAGAAARPGAAAPPTHDEASGSQAPSPAQDDERESAARTDGGPPSKRRTVPQAADAEYASVDPTRLERQRLAPTSQSAGQPNYQGRPAEAARELLGPTGRGCARFGAAGARGRVRGLHASATDEQAATASGIRMATARRVMRIFYRQYERLRLPRNAARRLSRF